MIIFRFRQIRIKRFYILCKNMKSTRLLYFKSFYLSMLDSCRHGILLLSIDVAHFWWTRNLRWKRFKCGYLRLLLAASVLTITFLKCTKIVTYIEILILDSGSIENFICSMFPYRIRHYMFLKHDEIADESWLGYVR